MSGSSFWVKPTTKALKQEYYVEVEIKGNSFFDSEKEFLSAVKKADVVRVDPALDRKISYRSNTSSYGQLLNLIRGYRSYPQFRNEKTLQNLYDRIGKELPMDMPLVLRFPDGRLRILSGNTRADVAMQMNSEYYALFIDV